MPARFQPRAGSSAGPGFRVPRCFSHARSHAKIRNVLALSRPLAEDGLVEVRLHGTVLYNSIYQADDQVLVNTHVHGNVANCAPVLRLRKISGGSMVATYLDCFNRIWDEAKPWNGEDA